MSLVIMVAATPIVTAVYCLVWPACCPFFVLFIMDMTVITHVIMGHTLYSESKKCPNDVPMLKDWSISQELLIGIK